VVAALAAHASAPAAYDWGGSRVWFPARSADAAQTAAIRAAVEAAGGHATLLRGPAVVPVFHPQPAPVEALSRRVKQGFDPHNLFGHEPLLRDVDGA
jgi:glycolate oxidase FAD binding subunit